MVINDVGVVGKAPHAIAVFRQYRKPWIRILDYCGLLPRGRQYRVELRNGLRFVVRASTGDLPIIDEPQAVPQFDAVRSEEHTPEIQSRPHLACRLLLEKKTNPL